ncbi:MAG: cation:dicarboxylase symporter family transporter, partial [Oscillospiraceae bacterium]
IQIVALVVFGYNPAIYLKKATAVMVLAFTSRSSVGCLPLTIETLVDKMGVNDGTASFVAGFGTTAGMQGCAGIFPALLLVFVANVTNMPIDFTYIAMTIVVVALGSLGIAGIPGTATMAASVALSGVGLAHQFPLISPILAIDPIIDMGRTFLNVTGSLSNAMIVDKTLGQVDMERFKNMSPEKIEK